MQIPDTLNIQCPSCGKMSLHNLKRGKLSTKNKLTYDCIVECSECRHVHREVITEKKHVELPVIISSQDNSERSTISLSPDARLHVGDEIMIDEINVKITGIELQNKRVKSAVVSEIMTLWCKRFDKIKLKLSIHSGSRTLSRSIIAVPDEEFYVGDIIKSGRDQIAIYKIKTRRNVIKDGGTSAREIQRLYGRFVR
ncbi:MAG: hypothetical protein JSV49_12525 [Thermoplasmata archaeon]|nr:MAG: hypothetical protein JSV49_12525 [Thermoplasmata archaeon]